MGAESSTPHDRFGQDAAAGGTSAARKHETVDAVAFSTTRAQAF
jgi:hypothetical protein